MADTYERQVSESQNMKSQAKVPVEDEQADNDRLEKIMRDVEDYQKYEKELELEEKIERDHAE